ncbi:putative sucrose-phosphate synthase 4 isoform X1 [Iris pallida]|uniref:Sucrose-phosphate synthase n=1 Tax=Iris pallida TaxID=29817 RepID=A0AAX6I8A8_IRIPA|nr:putative sucrose-phosphate synthase 4 isoform X1 [Iris pallida]
MARNEWINGYLEAILDAGSSKHLFAMKEAEAAAAAANTAGYSPTKYFVEEVVNRFDDSDLHKTWIKVVAMRNSQERNNRLENMCWRIWHLARKKKLIEWEEARLATAKKLEFGKGGRDAGSDELSELSEGEKEKGATDSPRRTNSEMKVWSEEDENLETRRLYIVLISLHGLVRGENMELGRDSDTGGQVKYVVELARALAATEGVYRVDLLTRQISSPDVHWTYGEPVEMLTHMPGSDASADGDCCGAYIIRLPCGPKDRYIPKESLWPHIPEFVDRAVTHITDVARSLGCQPTWPYVVHGHYADAAEVAARVSGLLNVPMAMTGHSLGRNKLEQLVKQGRMARAEIDSTYRIARRIEGEELGLDAAEMVVASTRQEIEEQWGLYDGFDVRFERKLRVRRRRGVSCLGRYMPRMVVIPPGMDFSYVNIQDLAEGDGDLSSLFGSDRGQSRADLLPPIWSEVLRFFTNPHKPMILALSRPDPKKNVTTLLKAFGECRALRELANLALILGNRDDIEEMHASSTAVLTAVLKLVDRYDLYGQVAYPKHHRQADVPEIYRLAAKTKGVFVNPALVEPFGLTLIEAAAYGLPVVATKNGGPVDILKALNNGLLVDPHDHKAISEALLKLVADKTRWHDCRRNGLKNIRRFSWPEHCRNYLSHVEHCRARHPAASLGLAPRAEEEPMSDSLRSVDGLSIQFSMDGAELKPNGDIGTVLEAVRCLRSEGAHAAAAEHAAGPGRRQRLFVIAADCYDAEGRIVIGDLAKIIESTVTGVSSAGGGTGYVFATGCTMAETAEALRRCRVSPGDFDALICSSGGEVYYPWRDQAADGDYGAHVEYRWPGEHVKSVVPRLAKADGSAAEGDLVVEEAAAAAGSHCYSYSIRAGAKVRKVDALRQRLRMRGFRCNLIYTRACTRLNVVPLFASRAHALRYLAIRWGVDLSKVVVLVGERGDTDVEELVPGLQRTLILRGLVAHGSERLLRDEEGYEREDVVPAEGAGVVYLAEGYDSEKISSAVEKAGISLRSGSDGHARREAPNPKGVLSN